jgi:hypothetical protein
LDKRCPRGLSQYPTEPCQEGKKAVDLARKGQTGGCPWYAADAESNYCFFSLMEQRGNGRPMPTPRIARVEMIDDTQVKKIVSNFRKLAKQIDDPDSPQDPQP